MNSIKNSSGKSAIGYVWASTMIHVTAFAALVLVPAWQSRPEGFGLKDAMAAFTNSSQMAPKGDQTETVQVGFVDDTKAKAVKAANQQKAIPDHLNTKAQSDQKTGSLTMALVRKKVTTRTQAQQKAKAKTPSKTKIETAAATAPSAAKSQKQNDEQIPTIFPRPKTSKTATQKLTADKADAATADTPDSLVVPVSSATVAEPSQQPPQGYLNHQGLESEHQPKEVNPTPATAAQEDPLLAQQEESTAADQNQNVRTFTAPIGQDRHVMNRAASLPPKEKVAASGGSARPFGISKGVQDARDLRQEPGNIPPVYPLHDRLVGNEGVVHLMYNITPDGRVTDVQLVRSSGHPSLDRAAIEAIQKYHYMPGQAGRTLHPVVFKLEGPRQALPSRLRVVSHS